MEMTEISNKQEGINDEKPGKSKTKGLSSFTATLFIAGGMAGSGVLALPRAIVNTGYIGILLLVIFAFNAAYGGIRLGMCWSIVEERYHEHRSASRNPYSVIASKAVGKWAGALVSNCIRVTLFGAGTVYLLLSSQILQSLLMNALPNIGFCTYFLIAAILVIPLMWLGSPKEFSIVGLGASLTTVIACVLFFTQIAFDGKNLTKPVTHAVHGFDDFFTSFGTILFAFGGASFLPTIQNDMEDKTQFPKSVSIAFGIIMVIYFPIAVAGFFTYGEDVHPNVTLSLTKTLIVDIGNILIAMHLVFAFLIVMNTVVQDIEELFKIPREFGWKRCLTRTTVVVCCIIVGETIPEFDKILSLIGGSTITLLTFVFPPYFYKKLCDREEPGWDRVRQIPLFERIYIWNLILIGILGGAASTFSAIKAIAAQDSFTKPCWWHLFNDISEGSLTDIDQHVAQTHPVSQLAP
ncbi:unnamed protein product [Acanthoscelides obtectus]|uniref:Amino acid transporter transmembrane domain-containing protein n=1 Tax=Acanthoscelides obtectus TaxID=200917 RepID=A0A9P0PVE3_ACAOB|nr:unnamed protein product [Acanthoscelides obtectus]CAK1652779.1 Amino acid transporter AVT1D [Acanthoscelides obtectus]